MGTLLTDDSRVSFVEGIRELKQICSLSVAKYRLKEQERKKCKLHPESLSNFNVVVSSLTNLKTSDREDQNGQGPIFEVEKSLKSPSRYITQYLLYNQWVRETAQNIEEICPEDIYISDTMVAKFYRLNKGITPSKWIALKIRLKDMFSRKDIEKRRFK